MISEPTPQPEPLRLSIALMRKASANSRYLWTDAYALENYLELARRTREGVYLQFALQLMDDVHHGLGKQRADFPTQGWLSGLSSEEGEKHPTQGGLRIGKQLPERPRNQPYDELLEWERDGQYFHYLTRWMLALHHLAEELQDSQYQDWAVELARTAHQAFVYRIGGKPRMYWKMSCDLSRPLVAAMGQHDPLDGFVTYSILSQSGADLSEALADFAKMLSGHGLATTDPLSLGGLLSMAAQLDGLDGLPALRDLVLTTAAQALPWVSRRLSSQADSVNRLAFRELGLAIGINQVLRTEPGRALCQHAQSLSHKIIQYWSSPQSQLLPGWDHHHEISQVMLASALLSLPTPPI
jgi:hypothetical protein